MVDKAALLGSWQLESAVLQRDGRDTTETGFGDRPSGFIHYLPDGRMAAMIAHQDQAPLASTASDAERLAAASLFTAYGGPYSIDGDVVTHHVDICSNPAAIGMDYVRHVRLDGDRLEIRTPPAIPLGRPMALVWRRVETAA